MLEIVLASASPRRKELLNRLNISFRVHSIPVDETLNEMVSVYEAIEENAMRKACAVAKEETDALVIGADTVVYCNDQVLGKPVNKQDAYAMLKMLSGNTHEVITGVCLVHKQQIKRFSVVSKVQFYPLTDEEIWAYIATGEPMDKAGAYGIQGKGAILVEKIDGDYYNIVGLPIGRLYREIQTYLKPL